MSFEHMNGRPVKITFNDGHFEIGVFRGILRYRHSAALVCERKTGELLCLDEKVVRFIDNDVENIIREYELRPIPDFLFENLRLDSDVYNKDGNKVELVNRFEHTSFDIDTVTDKVYVKYVDSSGNKYGLGDLFYYPYMSKELKRHRIDQLAVWYGKEE